MHREAIYVCTYSSGDTEETACVSAWDDREAAELLARELELERGVATISASDIRVRPMHAGGSTSPITAAASAPH